MKGRGVDNSSRTVGGMTVRTAMTDMRPRAPPRRAELSRGKVSQHGLPQSSRKPDSCSDKEARLRALRDQFQRDIDDTIAEMCSEKVASVLVVSNIHNLHKKRVGEPARGLQG